MVEVRKVMKDDPKISPLLDAGYNQFEYVIDMPDGFKCAEVIWSTETNSLTLAMHKSDGSVELHEAKELISEPFDPFSAFNS